jgi:hypothetical protein
MVSHDPPSGPSAPGPDVLECYDPGPALPPDPDEIQAPEVLEAGFTYRYGGTGTGFTTGRPLDQMLPGPDLAWHIGQARQTG